MAHHSPLTKSHRVGLSHIWVRPESWPDEFFPVRVRDLVGSEYFDRLVLVGPAVHHLDSPPPFQNGSRPFLWEQVDGGALSVSLR